MSNIKTVYFKNIENKNKIKQRNVKINIQHFNKNKQNGGKYNQDEDNEEYESNVEPNEENESNVEPNEENESNVEPDESNEEDEADKADEADEANKKDDADDADEADEKYIIDKSEEKIIDDSINDVIGGNIFPEQISSRKSDIFKNYEDKINIFYKKSRITDNFIRVILNNMYVMVDKNNNNKTSIVPPVIVNIKKYYIDLLDKNNEIYNKISILISNIDDEIKNKKEFDMLKTELKKINIEINEIKNILDNQENVIKQLNNEKTQDIFNLSKIYFKRKDTYNNINKTNINNKIINKILKVYKENKRQMLSEKDIKEKSQKLNISINDFKQILEWINYSKEYIELQTKINLTKKNIEKKVKLYNYINNNFILKMPEIDENKKINIS